MMYDFIGRMVVGSIALMTTVWMAACGMPMVIMVIQNGH